MADDNRPMNSATRRAGVVLGLALAITPLAGAGAQQVGVTSTAAGGPLGKPPALPQRVLKVGIDVFASERITTNNADRAHLLFLDGSSLTVGPDADITIDRYVYDPATQRGDMAMNATKGIFRLVGGKITKNGEATFKIGAATVGIRGGIAIVDASNPQQVKLFFLFGDSATFTTPQGTQTAIRPNSVIVGSPGQPPQPPRLATNAEIGAALGSLSTGAAGGTGAGAPTGTGSTIETSLQNSQVPASNSTSPATTSTTSTSVASTETANDTTGAGSGTGTTETTPPDPVPPSEPPPSGPVIVSAEGRFLREEPFLSFDNMTLAAPRDPANNSTLVSAEVNGDRLAVVSTAGPTFDLPWQPGAGVFPVTDGTSTLGPVAGYGFASANSDFWFYDLNETSNANNRLGVFGGTLTPVSGLPTTGFSAQQAIAIPGRFPFLPDDAATIPVIAGATPSLILHAWSPVLDVTAASSSDQRSVWFQSTVNISGTGGAQSSFMQINIGTYFTDETKGGNLYTAGSSNAFMRPSAVSHTTRYTSALSSAETTSGTAVYGPSGEYTVFIPEATFTAAGPVTTRTPQAGFEQPFNNLTGDPYYYATPVGPATTPAGLGTQRTTQTLNGFSAALVDKRDSVGTFSTYRLLNTQPENFILTTDPASNRAQATIALFNDDVIGNTLTLEWGGITGTSRSTSAFIDDKNFALRQSFDTSSTYNGTNNAVARIDMVTAGANPDIDWLPVGVTLCTCQYLTWGWWQGDIRYEEGPRTGERDRIHLGTWVAGEMPNVADLPISGNATYSGHMIGNVENTFNKYVAAGSFTNQWNFGTREGNFNATFDGANYAGTMFGSPANVKFTGGIGDTNDLSRTGAVAGSFFRSPTDAAAYQAGSFSISGPNYKAVGTFAGQR